jgi:hypothetical protein
MGFQFKDDKGNIVEQPGIYNMPKPTKTTNYLTPQQYEAIIKQMYADWAKE